MGTRAAARLRRQVFCEEQKNIQADDKDDIDRIATTLVAISIWASRKVKSSAPCVSIRPNPASGGDRGWRCLQSAAVSARSAPASSNLPSVPAHARGCRQFFAHVQSQNGLLFQRLNWRVIDAVELHGHLDLMEADLNHYPPFVDVDTGFHAMAMKAAEMSRPDIGSLARALRASKGLNDKAEISLGDRATRRFSAKRRSGRGRLRRYSRW